MELLARMTEHAAGYGARLVRSHVEHVTATGGLFHLKTADGLCTARRLLLATGVVNHQPPLERHDEAVARGLLRYCPICDGYEDRGKHILVIGNSERSLSELEFLRTYSDRVSLLPATEDVERLFADAGSRTLRPATRLWIDGDAVCAEFGNGHPTMSFDAMYAFLGVTPVAHLAGQLGVAIGTDGCIIVDSHQHTNIDGVYAAGDVVQALDQINVAIGHAAIAATAIHNSLRLHDAVQHR